VSDSFTQKEFFLSHGMALLQFYFGQKHVSDKRNSNELIQDKQPFTDLF